MDIKKWLLNIANSFQPAYDKIKAWELSPSLEKAFDEIWDKLPKALQDAAFKFLKEAYDKYGEEYAKKLLEKVLEWFKNIKK